MSSMRGQLVQRVTADLLVDDLLRLTADLWAPKAMAADGLAFGESYRPPRRGRPPVGLRHCWIRTVSGLLPAGRGGRQEQHRWLPATLTRNQADAMREAIAPVTEDGWAILIVVVAISAMSYFGVFDTVGMAYQPPRCTIDIGLTCLDHRIEYWTDPGDDTVHVNNLYMLIRNNRGDEFRITDFEIKQYGLARSWGEPDIALPNDKDTQITLGNFIVNDPLLQSGTRYKIEFEIGAINQRSGLPHTYKGTITGKVD